MTVTTANPSDQRQRAADFRDLHVPGRPLVLHNIWDPGSARAVAAAGATALATGSWSVATAFGFADGEQLPLALALDNLSRIVAATSLPVSIDLESGYGDTPAVVGDTVAEAVARGAVGCNLEDSIPATGALRDAREQAARIAAARAAADRDGMHAFVNLRCDVFFAPGDADPAQRVDEVLERARIYADAGADGLFVPGMTDADAIRRVVEASPLPVNVMVLPALPSLAEVARLGVARISFGPQTYRAAMQAVEAAVRADLAGMPSS